MRIYVAHTYGRRHGLSAIECESNTYKAIKVGRTLIELGHNPFIPNLFHFVHHGWEFSPDEDFWLRLVTEWLRFCDALLVAEMPPWKNSGVEYEIFQAKMLGMTIYNSLWDVPRCK